jgi:hypothetical protein
MKILILYGINVYEYGAVWMKRNPLEEHMLKKAGIG